MAGELGKASYTLDADLEPLRRNVKQSRVEVSDFERVLEHVTTIADITAEALKQVKIDPRQGAESRASASSIVDGVKGISEEARAAARELDNVRITDRQAAESDAAGDVIDRKLKDITGNANEARRSLESMRIAGLGAGGAGGGGGNLGGAGGGGFARVGLLGSAIGAGVLATPAAGPAALGLLASVPVLAGTAAGSLAVLALAFDGVGKAIGGDKKAFDDLGPSAQAFVQTVRSLDGWFDKIKETAAGSLFPGLTAGLKSALSPGTVGAITTAVSELGRALGAAGAQWGRYFGSSEFQSIFGPLMKSAANNIGTLSTAFMHLVDAVGVLGRGAIPLTTWMTKAVADGSRLFDTWLHAKDASGQLTGAMNEAKTSLELVGNLIVSLGRALGALGGALYPVSKIAVKDLTDGLNWLANMIDRNRQTIRDIVGGALAALVSAVKLAVPLVSALADNLKKVAAEVGGWKNAFEIVLSGLLAKRLYSVGLQMSGISKEAYAAMTMTDRLKTSLMALPSIVTIAVVLSLVRKSNLGQSALDKIGLGFLGHIPVIGGAETQVAGWGVEVGNAIGHKLGTVPADQTAASWANGTTGEAKPTTPSQALLSMTWPLYHALHPDATRAAFDLGQTIAKIGPGAPGDTGPGHSKPSGGGPAAPPYPTFGTPPPFTKNLGAGAKASAIPSLAAALLNTASGNASKALQLGNVGGTAKRYLENELADLNAAEKQLNAKIAGASGKNKTQLETALTGVENKIRSTQTLIKNSLLETGKALLPESLKSQLTALQTKFKADSTFAAVLTGSAAEAYQATLLDDITGQQKTLTSEVSVLTARLASSTGKQKKAISTELTTVTTQLAAVQEQVVQTLQGTVQTLQQKVSASFQSVQQELDQKFEAATQQMIDAAGVQFFQNGLQTPLEAQLASMQAQDQLKQLQDAVAQATDPASKAAAQRQLDEYDLGIRAAKERTDADLAYAAAVKKIQTDRTALENAMNKQLATLAEGFANGTATIGDLNALATEYGVTLDTATIPDLDNLTTATGQLQAAFKALADYIAQITGTAPPPTGPPNVAPPSIKPLDWNNWGIPVPPGVTAPSFASLATALSTSTSGGSRRDVVLMVDGRELARAQIDALESDPVGTLKLAKVVGPATGRVVSVG